MRVIIASATVLAVSLPPSMTVSQAASKKEASTARECQDAGRLAEVTLRFCSWKEGGVWNVSYEVKNGNSITKSVTLDCSQLGIRQSIADGLSAGAEKSFLHSKLAGKDRPEPFCKLDRVSDPTPRSSAPDEQ